MMVDSGLSSVGASPTKSGNKITLPPELTSHSSSSSGNLQIFSYWVSNGSEKGSRSSLQSSISNLSLGGNEGKSSGKSDKPLGKSHRRDLFEYSTPVPTLLLSESPDNNNEGDKEDLNEVTDLENEGGADISCDNLTKEEDGSIVDSVKVEKVGDENCDNLYSHGKQGSEVCQNKVHSSIVKKGSSGNDKVQKIQDEAVGEEESGSEDNDNVCTICITFSAKKIIVSGYKFKFKMEISLGRNSRVGLLEDTCV